MPDGRKINHLYYGSGHLHQLNLDGRVISDIERDDLHREIYRTQGGLTSRFGYDAMGRRAWQYASTVDPLKLSSIHNPLFPASYLLDDTRSPIERQYRYDPAGELTKTLDKIRGEVRYTYERNGQLQSRDTGHLVTHEHFCYDPAANRMDLSASTVGKVADNRLKKLNNLEFSYDAWGNLTTKRSGRWLVDVQEFKYDSENRLVNSQVWKSGRLASEGWYQYDSLGRRIKKRALAPAHPDPTEKTFLWQGLRLLQEQVPDGQRLYLYEPNSYAPLARIDDVEGQEQKTYYFHTDQIGTPLEMSDADGRIVWQATFKAWGEVQSLDVGEVEQNLRFQGQYFDAESGLHYNTFRYYDPQLGRFTTQDPIGLDGGLNLYSYAPSPTGWLDVLGLSCTSDAKKLRQNLGASPQGGGQYDAHHIVMSNSNDVRMLAMREKLKSLDIDINDKRNGIWLPNSETTRVPGTTATPHKGAGIHGENYKQHIFEKLSFQKTREGVLIALGDIKRSLGNGINFKEPFL